MSFDAGRSPAWGHGAVHLVEVARCSCGWICTRPDAEAATAAGLVHAIGHRARGGATSLPIRPLKLRAMEVA